MCELSEYDRLRIDCAKRYLATVHAARARLERQCARRIEQAQKMEPKAIVYSGMPASPNAYGAALPDAVAKLSVIDDAISAASAEWEEAVSQAYKCLYAMESPEYSELLERRYINGEQWAEITCAMGKGITWCQYSKLPALIQLYDTLPNEFRIPRVPAI